MLSLNNQNGNTELRAVAIWLFICAIMIFIMVVLGGVTRLTHSGLSMVEWQPLTGFLPPINEQDWSDLFRKYQQYPEFKIKNPTLDLNGFKSIFWLEFCHRLWGRLVGIVFFIPFILFMRQRRFDRLLSTQLAVVFILGSLQGALGWFMVKSGLANQPDVSQYRLTAHLILAFFLYGAIFWLAMNLLFPLRHTFKSSIYGYQHCSVILILLFTITLISGGFVAGTDAGFIYNTYPLMGSSLFPKDIFILRPWISNFFENIVTIQFTHRVLTLLLFIVTLGFYFKALTQYLPGRTRIALHSLLITMILQFSLGITTLLLAVPVAVAAAHQAGALLLLTVMLWIRHEFRT